MNYVKLSKEISYALRHAPWEFELEMDDKGWVPLNQLIEKLQISNEWKNIKEQDIKEMIEASDKKRHELADNKIRALYGHSLPHKILYEKRNPPKLLYHGTAHRFLKYIKNEGLQPRRRQYVHLSVSKEIAIQVGKRRDKEPVILIINASNANKEGYSFYFGNDKVWLADEIPFKYIKID